MKFELDKTAYTSNGGNNSYSTKSLNAVGPNNSDFQSRLTCHLLSENQTLESQSARTSQKRDLIVYKNFNRSPESHVTRSTNQKRGFVNRKDIRLVSPKIKKMSPKISPKIKLKLSHSNKKVKTQSEDKNMIKNNSHSVKKVKEIVRNFEANTVVNIDANTDKNTDLKKEKYKDAFEALMEHGKTGDTLKKTPVRIRVKRLENITSNQSILKWVSKSGRKGDHS